MPETPAIDVLDAQLADLLDPTQQVERVAGGFIFTEGPLWDGDDQSLLFSDIPADRIYRLQADGRVSVERTPSGKANGLTWGPAGELLACEHLGRRISARAADGTVITVVDSYAGRRLNSPNDLVMRSDGVLYFTDPPYGILSPEFGAIAEQEQPVNGLYALWPGQDEPTLLAGDFDRPNGLAFSPDERLLYVNDTSRYETRVYDVAPDGRLTGGNRFFSYPESRGQGRPDGMKVNAAGFLFATGPGGIWVLAPAGQALGHVRLPEKSANCAWGGTAGTELYIAASTSVYRLRTRQPGLLPRRAMKILPDKPCTSASGVA